jgi:hypothetical protein
MMTERVKLKEQDVETIQKVVRQFYPNWRRVLYALQRVCKSGSFDDDLV